jgi:hypothetical protein
MALLLLQNKQVIGYEKDIICAFGVGVIAGLMPGAVFADVVI